MQITDGIHDDERIVQGVDLDQVERGMVITVPNLFRSTQILDVHLLLLPAAPAEAPAATGQPTSVHLASYSLLLTERPGPRCQDPTRLPALRPVRLPQAFRLARPDGSK